MPEVHLAPPQPEDAEELLAFELGNRTFFELHINARLESYYSLGGVRAAIAESMREAAEDKAYQYLVRDDTGKLVGRVNLTRIRRAHFHSAELGYRIGQSACGKGYASKAVSQVIAKAFKELRLVRLEATARSENVGSGRVLVNNGFTYFGNSKRSFELAGIWHDLIHYELRVDA
ncbi:MAG: GNAT family N-acetyltransferase [Proteobacteria bacterium]|nr:GNAT family N-acetyltransferase [Pseudomonadota bacterium]